MRFRLDAQLSSTGAGLGMAGSITWKGCPKGPSQDRSPSGRRKSRIFPTPEAGCLGFQLTNVTSVYIL